MVTSYFDSGPGTLRNQIAAASSGDSIEFDSTLAGQTITLTSGKITIATGLTITGLGADQLQINGNNNSRIFNVDDGNAGTQAIVSISGLTLTNGNTAGDPIAAGGAILNMEDLTVTGLEITDNTGGEGGGINNEAGSHLTIVDSAIVNNHSSFLGGGILSGAGGVVEIINSTISGNNAANGGAIAGSGVITLTIRNSTITGNSATFNIGGVASATIESTIIAGNTAGSNDPDIAGLTTSLGNNFIGIIGSATGIMNGTNGDQVGTSASPLDPFLGPLANNGGQTSTHSLLSGSTAIDAGSNLLGLTYDQREFGFSRTSNGQTDVGAFEVQVAPPPPPPIPIVIQESGSLVITLTNGNDAALLTQIARDTVSIAIGGILFGPYSGVSRIQAYALGGDDTLTLANAVRIPLEFYGGIGADTLDASSIASLISTFVGRDPGTMSLFDSVEILDVGNVVFLRGATVDGTINCNGGNIDFSRLGFPIDGNFDGSKPNNVNGRLTTTNVDLAIASLFANNKIAPPAKNGTNRLGQLGNHR